MNGEPTFENGVVCAAAWLVSAHGEDSLALELIRHMVGTDAIARADIADREVLEPLLARLGFTEGNPEA